MARELVGNIGVDSGTIMIVDPCYVKHHKALTNGDNSDLLVDALKSASNGPIKVFDGVITHTRGGDGLFPVYATKNKEGRVTKLEIIF